MNSSKKRPGKNTKPRIFENTDSDAYLKARKGKTPEKRRAIYYKEKAKNQAKQESENSFSPMKSSFQIPLSNKSNSNCKLPPQRQHSIVKISSTSLNKETVLKKLDYESSKGVLQTCDSVNNFVLKVTGKSLTELQKDIVKSTVSSVAKEIFNKVFEEQKAFFEKVEMYIKVGKTIYKVISWIDEKTNDLKSEGEIEVLSSEDYKYQEFLKRYPKVNVHYQEQERDKCLSTEQILRGEQCPKIMELIKNRIKKNNPQDAPNLCEYYNFCHGIND